MIPFSVEKVFGTKARPPVKGTVNGFPFRNSLMPEGNGVHSMMFSKALQKSANAKAGDTVKVVLTPDTAPRTVTVPADFKKALGGKKSAKEFFDQLSYSHKKAYVDWITGAKQNETRTRRSKKALSLLTAKKKIQ